MWTALIGALAALVGIIIGQILARSGEYRKWIRAEQHKACASFLEACESIKLQHVTYTAIREVATAAGRSNLRKSPEIRAHVRNMIEHQLGGEYSSELSNEDLEEAIDLLFEHSSDEIDAALAKQGKASVGRDEKSHLDEVVAGTTRLMHAIESLRLICPDSVAEKADRLHIATLGFLSAKNDHKEADRIYAQRRVEFTKEARSLFFRKLG
ncbi:hypothetical protein ACWDV4_00110 [Micromonospora sp. NPDC003197]